MSTRVQLRRGTTAEHATFTGAEGELTVDTEKKSLVVHDGVTVGGNPVGGYSFSSSSGANQSISFAQNGLHEATCDVPTVTFSFTDAAEFAKVDLVLDFNVIDTFELSNAYYDNVSFSVSSQDSNPYGIAFSTDGTKMFMVGTQSDTVHQYSLSTAWYISSASYDNVSFSVSSQDNSPYDIAFSSDGTKMFMVGTSSDSVHQYSLSNAWDISSASYDNVSYHFSSQDAQPFGIAFSSDGTKMFMVGNITDSVHQYSLSTTWDISSASYDNVSFSVSSQDSNPRDVAFSADGTKMIMLGTDTDSVHQYSLSTAWDISSASYDNVSFSVSSQDSTPSGIKFSSDGTKMFMVGLSSDSVNQYTTEVVSTLVMPSELEWTQPNIRSGRYSLSIYTTDSGTSYKVVPHKI